MTDPDMMTRLSAGRILSQPFVKNLSKRSKNTLNLYQELKRVRLRVKELEKQLLIKQEKSPESGADSSDEKVESQDKSEGDEEAMQVDDQPAQVHSGYKVQVQFKVGKGMPKSKSCYQ